MNRFFGHVFAVVIIYLIAIFLPSGIGGNLYFQALIGIVILALLGSALLWLVFDVDKWPDRGYVIGAVWAGAGAGVMHFIWPSLLSSAQSDLISGDGLWAGMALELFNLAIGMIVVAVPVGLIVWLVASVRGKGQADKPAVGGATSKEKQ
jgi:hypothetical protein